MIYSLPPGAMTCSIAATAWIQIVELHQVIPPTFIASFTDPGGIWGSKSTCDWHCWATYAWKEYWIMRTLFMHNSASECDWCRWEQNQLHINIKEFVETLWTLCHWRYIYFVSTRKTYVKSLLLSVSWILWDQKSALLPFRSTTAARSIDVVQ